MTTPPSAAELMDCPFCGGRAQFVRQTARTAQYSINCTGCLIETAWRTDTNALAGYWNTRPTPQPADGVTDEMVRRACEAFYVDDAWRTNTNRAFDFMRTALQAAALPTPTAPATDGDISLAALGAACDAYYHYGEAEGDEPAEYFPDAMEAAIKAFLAHPKSLHTTPAATDAVRKLIGIAKQARNRLNYLNMENGLKIDCDLVFELDAALAKFPPETKG